MGLHCLGCLQGIAAPNKRCPVGFILVLSGLSPIHVHGVNSPRLLFILFPGPTLGQQALRIGIVAGLDEQFAEHRMRAVRRGAGQCQLEERRHLQSAAFCAVIDQLEAPHLRVDLRGHSQLQPGRNPLVLPLVRCLVQSEHGARIL